MKRTTQLKQATLLTALVIGLGVGISDFSVVETAEKPPCHDNDKLCWQMAANEEWKQEYGDMPPALSDEAQAELKAYLQKKYPEQRFY
ncbi:hypothetical protein ACUHGC_05385 [Testudinibacter sp. P27/CKL/0425]